MSYFKVDPGQYENTDTTRWLELRTLKSHFIIIACVCQCMPKFLNVDIHILFTFLILLISLAKGYWKYLNSGLSSYLLQCYRVGKTFVLLVHHILYFIGYDQY